MPQDPSQSADRHSVRSPFTEDWPESIASLLRLEQNPGPGPFHSISSQNLGKIALQLGISVREAMLRALGHGVWPLRFKNNRGVFTAEQQAALLRSKAAIIGCGGLGGHVALLLARAGVGSLCLCDPDVFEESNLNRQAFCREDRIGVNKAEAGREELLLVASHAEISAVSAKADAKNLPGILDGADIAIDCLDDIATRLLLEKAAHAAGMPFVHGAIAGCEAFALASTPSQGSAVARLYGEKGAPGASAAEFRLGVPTPTPAAAALLQVLLAIRLLAGVKIEPPNALWHIDLALPELLLLRY